MQIRLMAIAVYLCSASLAAGADCPPAPEPVVELNYGSRYQDSDKSRSQIDKASNAEVNKALRPIEEFLRDLVRDANKVIAGGAAQAELADCVIDRLAIWASADALSDLGSFTANLSIGSRYAGFAFVYRQVRPFSRQPAKQAVIERWLHRRTAEQMLFWEEDATPGAKRGNLRAWATLGVNLVADLTGDEVALRWSAWSASFLQCQALADGSLPQEMKRGKYALHYQLHAIAPLVVTTALLQDQGHPITGVCGNALKRIVTFALDDLSDGKASAGYSGETQSYFDGTETLESFELAWLAAYLHLYADPKVAAFAERFKPLGHSKLGGKQALIWPGGLN